MNRSFKILTLFNQVVGVEVLGRVLSGIAPWLQLESGDEQEVALRKQYREYTIQGLKNSLDSNVKDFMNYDVGGQQLVDASYMALALSGRRGCGKISEKRIERL